MLKDLDRALQDSDSAVSLGPEAESLARRGTFLFEAGRHVEAWSDYDAATRMLRPNDTALANATVYLPGARFEDATAACHAEGPTQTNWLRAEAHKKRGNDELKTNTKSAAKRAQE